MTDLNQIRDAVAHEALQEKARDHLWLHFSRHSAYESGEMPVIVRGVGAYIYDSHGKRYLDGLAGLFVNQ
ncbi:MAG: aspartate aminotransferase family protein, partial [Nocardioides sp.]